MNKIRKILSTLFLIFCFSVSSISARPKIALVLGGGGARGLAEIPFLTAIEEEGIPIDLIVGTSIGSIIGGLYCSGYSPKEVRDFVLNMDYLELFAQTAVEDERFLPNAFEPPRDNYASFEFSKNGIGAAPGFLGDNRINLFFSNSFSRVLKEDDFDKLPIPFRAVATNASTGERIVIGKGSINSAVRASMSIPLVWEPYPIGENYTFDGGVSCNIPVSVAKELGADVIIAIDVSDDIYVEPEKISGIESAGVQLFSLLVSNKNEEEHKLADIVFTPKVGKYSAADFFKYEEIMNIGQECLNENRTALHELALKLQNQGVPLSPKNPERQGSYSLLPDPVVEEIIIKDISLVGSCPLPTHKDFEFIIGKVLDDTNKQILEKKLEELRKKYHLTSLLYTPRKSSDENNCILEIHANHYHNSLNKFFAGGENIFSIGKKDNGRLPSLKTSPEIFMGTYFASPVEMCAQIEISNFNKASFSIMPKVFETDRGRLITKSETTLEIGIGNLATESNYLNRNRKVAEDNAFGFQTGFTASFLDVIKLSTSLDFKAISLYSDKSLLFPANIIIKGIYSTLDNQYTDTSGIQMEVLTNYGVDLRTIFPHKSEIEFLYNAALHWSNRYEFKEFFSCGFDFSISLNRNNWRLNEGYQDYGGLYGLCGNPNGILKRDFILGGITAQYKITDFAGLPLIGILKCNAGFSDSYNPFVNTERPSNDLFAGCSQMDFGGSAYVGLKTMFGSLLLGGGLNTTGQWCLTFAFN